MNGWVDGRMDGWVGQWMDDPLQNAGSHTPSHDFLENNDIPTQMALLLAACSSNEAQA